MTEKQSATKQSAQEYVSLGFKRDPAKTGAVIFVSLPERITKPVENDATYRAAFHQLRGAGKGVAALLYPNKTEHESLVKLFEALNTADGRWAVRRLNECLTWGSGLPVVRIKGDGYPVRETTPEMKLTDVAVHKPKATAARTTRKPSQNPRTQTRAMVNRVVKRAQATKQIRKATPDEQAQVEAILSAGDSAQETA